MQHSLEPACVKRPSDPNGFFNLKELAAESTPNKAIFLRYSANQANRQMLECELYQKSNFTLQFQT